MRVLIVDDSYEKAAEIWNEIKVIEGLSENDIQLAYSLNDARAHLREVLYDLMILDLHIPAKIGESPCADVGIAFVDEILSSIGYNLPMDIVALTAYKEAKEKFTKEDALSGFTIMTYDRTQSDWRKYIVSRTKYLLMCSRQRKIEKRLPECDVLWITAVDIETKTVRDMYEWKSVSVDNDSSHYFVAEQRVKDKTIHIIHVQLSDMGIASAASTTTKAILHFSPKYVVMTGIAAGLDSDMRPNDVMIADNVWNYDSGKYIEQEENGTIKVKLAADVKTLDIDFALKQNMMEFLKCEKERDFKISMGIFACGSAVVASDKKIQESIKSHSRKTIGVDMESYGVMYAAMVSSIPQKDVIIIKGMSDKGDTNKDDSAQYQAAKNSAYTARELIEYLFTNEH